MAEGGRLLREAHAAGLLARFGFHIELDEVGTFRLPIDDTGRAASIGLAMHSEVEVEIHVTCELQDSAARCAHSDGSADALLVRHRASVRRAR